MANKFENVNRCKQIAEELERYVNGVYYRCSECGDVFTWDDVEVKDDECYYCPHCGDMILEGDLEQCSVYDWPADVLDVEYRCGSKSDYRSVRIMVAFGGPNIFVDTASKQVELYWWTETASYPISSSAAEALDEWAEEHWNCL